MAGIDTLISKSFSISLKNKIEKNLLKKIELELFSKHGVSIKHAVEDFQILDKVLKNHLKNQYKKIEEDCLKQVCSIKKNGNGYSLKIIDDDLAGLIFRYWGDKENKLILNATLVESLPVSEILSKCKIPKTSAYRKINHLIRDGMLIQVGKKKIEDGKIIPKYKNIFNLISFMISENEFSVSGKISENILKSSTILSGIDY